MDPSELDTKTLVLLLVGQVRDRVCSHPLSTLAGAATLGYMVGWSLPTPLYRAVASMAARSIMMHVATTLLGSVEDEDMELLLEDEEEEDERDLAGPKDRRQVDVPPYVA